MASDPDERMKKRGPFLPRGDLTNKSPEDDDDDDDFEQSLKVVATATNSSSGNSRPPQPPQLNNNNNNKRKKQHHLPVKSSGYGRVVNNNSNSRSSSSSRPSTPIERRAASSPANNSITTIRSTSKLRHGDGTLSISSNNNSVGKFKKNRAAMMMVGVRSRSPSPASSLRHQQQHHQQRSRARTPSPVVKTRIIHHDKIESSGMKKKLKSQHHHQKQQQQHSSIMDIQRRSPSPQTQLLLLSNDYKDYSQIDADPTPVKEARRLSSIFHNRASSSQPLASLNEDLSSPLARTTTGSSNINNDKSPPLSYSKALRKGLHVNDTTQGAATTATTATVAAAATSSSSSPLSAMKLFQPSENNTNAQKSSDPTLLFNGYDNNPKLNEITNLSNQIFSRASGIDTPNLQCLLKKKSKKKSNNSSENTIKQWDLRKRLEKKEEELGILRTAMNDLLSGKELFVEGAIDIERKLRNKFVEVQCIFGSLTNEKTALQKELKDETDTTESFKEQIQELQRERDSYKTKWDMIQSECHGTRQELGKLQQSNTEYAVALALLESKLEESNSQKEAALLQVGSVASTKDDAIKEAETKIAKEMGEELSKMEKENDMFKAEVKERRARDEEICRMMNLDVGSVVDFTVDGVLLQEDDEMSIDNAAAAAAGRTNSFLKTIKQRLEEFQKDVKEKEEVERSLDFCKVELEKVKAEYQAALDAAAGKDRDMSELMKSIGDIQRSGQEREQDVANQRKAAEDRAAAAESQLVDLREQLLSLGYEKKSLEETLETSKAACTAHESTIATLQKEIAESKIENVQHDSQLQLERDLRAKAEEKENDERAERIALAAQLNAQLQESSQSEKQLRESMESMERTLTEQVRLKEGETKAKVAQIEKCKETITALEANKLSLQEALSEQKTMLDASQEEEIGRLRGEVANLESKLKSEVEKLQSAGIVSEARVWELEEIIRKGQAERKRMHNMIQELRGNVRVFARIRPFLPNDGKQSNEDKKPSVSHEGDLAVTVTKPSDPSQRHRFSFDRVFAPSAGQEALFDEVSEFVQSALDGYNVCLFSYGQTGSGKTHTMQGAGTGVMRGLIPRSIEQIGSHKTQLEKDGWSFAMEISFLEIYNESLRDLLRENPKVELKHEIKVGSDGRRTVTNLTVKPIDPNDRASVEEVLSLAAKRRSTASTDMNATSSRSHSVFTLNLTAKHEEKNQAVRGTLNLVDLAGSERLDRSNAIGQQAKEAMAINKSLSSLADVFTAIGQKQNHIPFRNSRLTYLLQPALSGDGKTCMVVNISPTEASVQESLSSLRFAVKVNKCELGKAKRTIEEVKNGTSKRTGTGGRNVKRKI